MSIYFAIEIISGMLQHRVKDIFIHACAWPEAEWNEKRAAHCVVRIYLLLFFFFSFILLFFNSLHIFFFFIILYIYVSWISHGAQLRVVSTTRIHTARQTDRRTSLRLIDRERCRLVLYAPAVAIRNEATREC